MRCLDYVKAAVDRKRKPGLTTKKLSLKEFKLLPVGIPH
jgi:hypothetical protein